MFSWNTVSKTYTLTFFQAICMGQMSLCISCWIPKYWFAVFYFWLPGDFNIYTREAGAGGLSIAVEGPSKAEIEFHDRKDGSCGVTYSVAEPGTFLYSILVIRYICSQYRHISLLDSCQICRKYRHFFTWLLPTDLCVVSLFCTELFLVFHNQPVIPLNYTNLK